MPDLIRRNILVQVKVERALALALDAAARQRGQSRSEFARQSIRAQLRADGVSLSPVGGDEGLEPASAARRIAA